MKQTIDLNDFRNAFARMGRLGNFSYDGLEVLFDYIETYEEESGQEVELDIIDLCCTYSESTLDEINFDYEQEFEDIDSAKDWLNGQTIVCGTTENGVGEETIVFVEF